MRRILIHFDTDPAPSAFDRVVAVDAGVDELFSYGGVSTDSVEPLVHGAIFTRGPADLKNTAIFVGGSRVEDGQRLFERIGGVFFGPMRVSVMVDSNGSNTTASAAVLSARKHVPLKGAAALVLGGSGPVGQRVAELLAREGARVWIGSRSLDRADAAVEAVRARVSGADLSAVITPGGSTSSGSDLDLKGQRIDIVIAAGAAGARLLSASQLRKIDGVKVAIDLNAVPPARQEFLLPALVRVVAAGIEGIGVTDKGQERDGLICYGAIGVGGLKMKIHKACLSRLFESNDQVLDTAAIFGIGQALMK